MKSFRKFLKGISLMLIVTVILSSVMPTNVYAANDKKQIQTTLKKVFKAARTMDDKTIYKNIVSNDPSQMEYIKKLRKQSAFGELKKTTPSAFDYIQKNNKNISYKVTKTVVKGKKATVKMKVKYVNSKGVARNIVKNLSNDLQSDEFVAKVNALDSTLAMTDFFTSYSEGLFAKSISENTIHKSKTQTIQIVMKKVKGKWMITDEDSNGFEAFGNVLFADLEAAIENEDVTTVDYSKIETDKLMLIIFKDLGLDTTKYPLQM